MLLVVVNQLKKLTTRLKEIEDKIPNHDKYVTTFEFNKFFSEVFDENLNQIRLGTKADMLTVSKTNILSQN